MADYAKKKNDELAALCKERSLPHTGKKAELVKRLEDHDAQSSTDVVNDHATTDVKTKEEAPKPVAADSTQQDDQPAKSSDAPTTATADQSDDGVEKKSEDFKLGLEERTLDEEIAKRKKRAEKFGMDISKDETLKLLERAKRFGSNNVPGLLNQALPERAERSKKRGHEDKDDRKRSRQRGNNDQPKKEQKDVKTDGHPSWMTDKDREAAERRKAKFQTTE